MGRRPARARRGRRNPPSRPANCRPRACRRSPGCRRGMGSHDTDSRRHGSPGPASAGRPRGDIGERPIRRIVAILDRRALDAAAGIAQHHDRCGYVTDGRPGTCRPTAKSRCAGGIQRRGGRPWGNPASAGANRLSWPLAPIGLQDGHAVALVTSRRGGRLRRLYPGGVFGPGGDRQNGKKKASAIFSWRAELRARAAQNNRLRVIFQIRPMPGSALRLA